VGKALLAGVALFAREVSGKAQVANSTNSVPAFAMLTIRPALPANQRPPGVTRAAKRRNLGALVLRLGSLRTNAYRYVFALAVLTPKSNVADEAVASNAAPLQQECERIICSSTAATGQPEPGISLQLGLVDGPAAPILIGFSSEFAHAAGLRSV